MTKDPDFGAHDIFVDSSLEDFSADPFSSGLELDTILSRSEFFLSALIFGTTTRSYGPRTAVPLGGPSDEMNI